MQQFVFNPTAVIEENSRRDFAGRRTGRQANRVAQAKNAIHKVSLNHLLQYMWLLKSSCGRLLASQGFENVLNLWAILSAKFQCCHSRDPAKGEHYSTERYPPNCQRHFRWSAPNPRGYSGSRRNSPNPCALSCLQGGPQVRSRKVFDGGRSHTQQGRIDALRGLGGTSSMELSVSLSGDSRTAMSLLDRKATMRRRGASQGRAVRRNCHDAPELQSEPSFFGF